MPGILFFSIHCIFITLLVVVWKRNNQQAPLRAWIVPGVCLKILAGIAVGLFFQRYYGYGGDSWNIHYSATELSRVAWQNPLSYLRLLLFNEYYHIPHLSYPNMWEQPRYLFVVKLVSVLHLLTGTSYWLTSFYLSLFSFWGLWQLANTLTKQFPTTRWAAIAAFLLFPSVVFWSSGLQKESLAIGVIGWMVHQFLQAFLPSTKQSYAFWLKSSVLWWLGIAWLWQLKFYYMGGLVPVMLSIALAQLATRKLWPMAAATAQARNKLWLFVVFFAGLLWLASMLHPKLHLSQFMHVLVLNHNASFNFSNPDDVIHYARIGGGYFNITSAPSSLLYNTPLAFVSGLFRPFIWEANNKVKLLAGVENLWLMGLLCYAVVFLIKDKCRSIDTKQHPKLGLLLVGALTYITLLAVLLALASPNLGSLSRYKVGFLPFMAYLLHLPLSFSFHKWWTKRKKT
ncbi:hypothetical protein [Microscilla marina]|uniref:hypothetical protein n=1 Tax=Microscilla marina TaxID=1027 RepID=UPI0012F9C342|nr:hypothetical protein [Microscilla marina]